jgi:hypothetical protein
MFTVMDFRTRTDFEVLRNLQQLKGWLKKRFDQIEILITVQELLRFETGPRPFCVPYLRGPSSLLSPVNDMFRRQHFGSGVGHV